jgi:hypothetical protein
MEQGATARAPGVPNRPGGDGKWSENAKKMFFSGNKPKDSLKIKDLAFFGAQNKLLFECKKRRLKPGVRAGNWKLETRKQGCQFPVSDF